MRLATITNWAYGATVLLTLVSGTTMLLSSSAQEQERVAVERRFALDRATERLAEDVYRLTDRARQYLNTDDATYQVLYTREAADTDKLEERLRRIAEAGATPGEVAVLREGLRWADSLRDEQTEALAAQAAGNTPRARQILFGAEYERELDRAITMVERFQEQLDQRTEIEIAEATRISRIWRTTSEVMLAITAFLFLCVLYFVFKRRVLRPVVRLSDVVNRLAAQDYGVEPPTYEDVDEIGDMAQAIRVFRENGIERQRLEAVQEAERASRALLARMTQRMQGCDTLDALTDVVRRFVPEIVPGFAGRLYVLDPDSNRLEETGNWLDPQHSGRAFSTLDCWALRRGLPHRPAGETIDVPCTHLDLDGADELPDTLCLPLIAQRQTLGLIYFESRKARGEQRFPENYLQMLSENIGLALSNLRLRERLQAMALTDSLTGLSNRRNFEEELPLSLAKAEREAGVLSFLMLDIDHFKRINDGFGHEAGDAVLRAIGTALRQALREDTRIFRYGGEEFLVMLPGTDSAQAMERAEDLRARIGGLEILHHGEPLGPVTVSIGLATTPDHCPAAKLLRTADAALYRAKDLGRNRVEVAQPRKDERRAT
ncbi:sensor domain-containing diguanylate cyclase [Novosphingobium decolorationis]|uniref:diguanylate cyclase n=1 Tax=Novosphingobium decolorationis TaxID=2698673 RepID=A0ABX8ECM7_9SPHN|nr:diguanylate cyclase [Novosphingobium decolorationis]QVM85641.1 diguanylate cyclase [Novosphingobium decolorationis]